MSGEIRNKFCPGHTRVDGQLVATEAALGSDEPHMIYDVPECMLCKQVGVPHLNIVQCDGCHAVRR